MLFDDDSTIADDNSVASDDFEDDSDYPFESEGDGNDGNEENVEHDGVGTVQVEPALVPVETFPPGERRPAPYEDAREDANGTLCQNVVMSAPPLGCVLFAAEDSEDGLAKNVRADPQPNRLLRKNSNTFNLIVLFEQKAHVHVETSPSVCDRTAQWIKCGSRWIRQVLVTKN